jgi:hypothetical protein
LTANGSHATASSQDTSGGGRWPASGVIDGLRDDVGWGAGHGWASKAGEPLPQWVEVKLPQERTVNRFVVITYQKDNSEETAGKWGVQNYALETWDLRRHKWKPSLAKATEFPVKVRVHQLPKPVRTDRFRIVVTAVAPLDGQARLLQVEAWGP